MKRLALATASLAWLCSASITWAHETRSVEFQRYTTNTVGEVQADCGTFLILGDYTITWEVKFVDGVLVANHLRQDPAKYYNSTDPTIFVMSGPGEQQNNNHIDVETGDFSATMHFKVIVPGGPLLMDTGLFVANMYTYTLTRSTGQNDWVNGNFAALCEYLSVPHEGK